jgi:hypothetical protein
MGERRRRGGHRPDSSLKWPRRPGDDERTAGEGGIDGAEAQHLGYGAAGGGAVDVWAALTQKRLRCSSAKDEKANTAPGNFLDRRGRSLPWRPLIEMRPRVLSE